MSLPFGDEKLWSHRVFVTFARELATRGFPVLHFDYQGSGERFGNTVDANLDAYIADPEKAIETIAECRRSLTRIGIAGLRLGATAAALVLEKCQEQRCCDAPLILWGRPILGGTRYFQELRRINLETQLVVNGKAWDTTEALHARIGDGGNANVDGYDIGAGLHESSATSDLQTTGAKRHTGLTPVLGAEKVCWHIPSRAWYLGVKRV